VGAAVREKEAVTRTERQISRISFRFSYYFPCQTASCVLRYIRVGIYFSLQRGENNVSNCRARAFYSQKKFSARYLSLRSESARLHFLGQANKENSITPLCKC
jgi:hypothetical protein